MRAGDSLSLADQFARDAKDDITERRMMLVLFDMARKRGLVIDHHPRIVAPSFSVSSIP